MLPAQFALRDQYLLLVATHVFFVIQGNMQQLELCSVLHVQLALSQQSTRILARFASQGSMQQLGVQSVPGVPLGLSLPMTANHA
jgi:hypothetical protein